MTVRLHPTYDREHDVLSVLEYGRVAEGQPDGCWRAVGGRVLVLHDGVNGPEVGVWVSEASRLDVHAGAVAGLWGHPRFDVPMVGLTAACAGDVILAARALFGGRASIGHGFLGDLREAEDDDEAEQIWRAALECGDMYAHLGLGRVLYALGRDQEAYRHLRYYTELAPRLAAGWCWCGRAAEALGNDDEARAAYRRAIALDDGDAVDARAALDALDARLRGRWGRRGR